MLPRAGIPNATQLGRSVNIAAKDEPREGSAITKSLGAAFGTLVFGFAICPVQAENVIYDYTGSIYSGIGAGGSLSGQFGYDPTKITGASTQCGTGNEDFGTFCHTIYDFSDGGRHATYSGALTGEINGFTGAIEVIDGSLRDYFRYRVSGRSEFGSYHFMYQIATTDTTWLNGTDIPPYLYVPKDVDPGYRSRVNEHSAACGQEIGYTYFAPANSAGRRWLAIRDTWNVPMEDMLAACEQITGRCTGSVTVQGSELDLSGYVWASRMEAINCIIDATAIPVDLTGTIYPEDELWYFECTE